MRLTLKQRLVNGVLRGVGRARARRYPADRTILLACHPRGGSTWLLELLLEATGSVPLWEPFDPASHPELLKGGLRHDMYVSPDDESELTLRLCRAILTGSQLGIGSVPAHYLKVSSVIHPRRYIAKMIRGNLLLPWLVRRFGCKAVLLLRHPCAVVASQLRHPGWKDWKIEWAHRFVEELGEPFPRLADVFESVRTLTEALAFEYAARMLVPLSQPEPHPWLVVTYEEMVLEPRKAVRRIVEYLELEDERRMLARWSIPSSTTHEDSDVKRGGALVESWKRTLEPRQVDQVLRIVHQVGVRCYTEGLTVNMNALKPLS